MVGALAGGWALYLRLTGNVHEVSQGVAYRSAQLEDDQLIATVEEYHIKSIINLRGDNLGDDWYTGELALSSKRGVAHYDIGMSSNSESDRGTVERLLAALETAPRPLLIHCYGGADRSGLASALFKRFVEGKSVDEAAEQLSFRYGHFPWFGSRTVAMDHAFMRMVSAP
jgi:protein tyrosine/serine phosphatase